MVGVQGPSRAMQVHLQRYCRMQSGSIEAIMDRLAYNKLANGPNSTASALSLFRSCVTDRPLSFIDEKEFGDWGEEGSWLAIVCAETQLP